MLLQAEQDRAALSAQCEGLTMQLRAAAEQPHAGYPAQETPAATALPQRLCAGAVADVACPPSTVWLQQHCSPHCTSAESAAQVRPVAHAVGQAEEPSGMGPACMHSDHAQLQGELESVRGRLEAVQQERDSLAAQACNGPAPGC